MLAFELSVCMWWEKKSWALELSSPAENIRCISVCLSTFVSVNGTVQFNRLHFSFAVRLTEHGMNVARASTIWRYFYQSCARDPHAHLVHIHFCRACVCCISHLNCKWHEALAAAVAAARCIDVARVIISCAWCAQKEETDFVFAFSASISHSFTHLHYGRICNFRYFILFCCCWMSER